MADSAGNGAAMMVAITCFIFMTIVFGLTYAGQYLGNLNGETFNGTSTSPTDFVNQADVIAAGGVCAPPRVIEGAYMDETVLSCDWVTSVSQSACTNVSGCRWENVTSGFWFWQTSNTTCVGEINESYLREGIGDPYCVIPSAFGNSDYLSRTNNNTLWCSGSTRGSTGGICTTDKVLFDQNLCGYFGCTWMSATQYQYSGAKVSFTSVLGQMFGFSTNYFGMPASIVFYMQLFTYIITFMLIASLAIFIASLIPF